MARPMPRGDQLSRQWPTVAVRRGLSVDSSFFERPILNSPYVYPGRHWDLDADGQPTGRLIETRRDAKFITPIPCPKKHKRVPDASGVRRGRRRLDHETAVRPHPHLNELRHRVDQWRAVANPVTGA